MKTAGRKKCSVAWFDTHFVNVIGRRSLTQRGFELILRNRFTEPEKKFRAWLGVGNVPKFSFRFAAQFRRDFFGRMNLQGKLLMCVEKFDEQWKSRSVGNRAEDRRSMLDPQFMQSFAFESPARDNALCFGTINNFPRLANALLC